MNDITRERAQRVIERQVADGSMIRLGDGRIIERDRRAQQTASQAVIMTSTAGHGAHLIAIWWDRCASRYCISGSLIEVAACKPRTSGRGGNAVPPFRVSRLSETVRSEKLGWCADGV